MDQLTPQQIVDYRRYHESLVEGGSTRDLVAFDADPEPENSGNLVPQASTDVVSFERQHVVKIDSKKRDVVKYPNQNYFKLPFGKSLQNISKIEIIESSFANTDQVVVDTPASIQNNIIAWENQEDESLGISTSVAIATTVPDTVDLTIVGHGIGNHVRVGTFHLKIINSTSTPNCDGEYFAYIIDANTLRFDFTGGISGVASCTADTGIPNYSILLTPGSYSVSTLCTEIAYQMNRVKRRDGNGIYNYCTVTPSLDTDVIAVANYITKQLPTAPISVTAGSGTIVVNSIDHGFFVGDQVLMISIASIAGITATDINGLVTVTQVLSSDQFTYEIPQRANASVDAGGSTVKTGTPAPFRFLFNTAASKLVEKIGHHFEDSSEPIGASDPITTYAIPKIASIQNLSGSIRVTCSSNHDLIPTVDYHITNISTGSPSVITTGIPHNLRLTSNVYIKCDTCVPKLDGFYPILGTGSNTFVLSTVIITSGATSGIMNYTGDKIKFFDFSSIPDVSEKYFFVKNVTTTTFDVDVNLTYIDDVSVESMIVGTNRITVQQPNHGFNIISSVTGSGGSSAIITTSTNHGKSGHKYTNISASTNISNTVDLVITGHGLTTSQKIHVTQSTTSPSINGDYIIQVVDVNTIRITFVGGVLSGLVSVFVGDTVIISDTNSAPAVIGEYWINVVGPDQFIIDLDVPISSPGNYGIIGRQLSVAIYRMEGTVVGSVNFAGIATTDINGVYFTIARILDLDHYVVYLDSSFASQTVTTGGDSVYVTSEHNGKKKIQYNTIDGTINTKLYRSVDLSGEDYIFIVSPGLDCVFVPGGSIDGDIFAIINLNQPPNYRIYDSFVSAPITFIPLLAKMDGIELSIVRQDGIFYNLNNTDYSISLRITEIAHRLKGTGINTGMYALN